MNNIWKFAYSIHNHYSAPKSYDWGDEFPHMFKYYAPSDVEIDNSMLFNYFYNTDYIGKKEIPKCRKPNLQIFRKETLNTGVIEVQNECHIVFERGDKETHIMYTIDGSIPNRYFGEYYQSDFLIKKSCILQAITFKNGHQESDLLRLQIKISTGAYTHTYKAHNLQAVRPSEQIPNNSPMDFGDDFGSPFLTDSES